MLFRSDIPYFLARAKTLYGYNDFIADTGGSLIEVIELENPDDPVVRTLREHTVLLYIKGTDDDANALIKRYEKTPKPMYYRPDLLVRKWAEFKNLHHIENDEDVDPTSFAIWGFEAILADRLPRYQALADRFGYIIDAADLRNVRDGKDFLSLMQKAISKRPAG